MNLLLPLLSVPWLHTMLALLALGLLTWLSGLLSVRLLPQVVRRLKAYMLPDWNDALLKHRSFLWLARLIPVLIVQQGIDLVPGVPVEIRQFIFSLGQALLILFIVMAVNGGLLALEDVYRKTSQGRQHSIKSVIQLLNIGLFIIAGLLVITSLTGEKLTLLLSGLGAMSAVLMLVFKDTLLGFVASLQLSGNKMLRVGDWIEMPLFGADGEVIDIALHTVKVRNWDNTIIIMPSWRLISDAYKNWCGMYEAGGRRLKRALCIDAASVGFLDPGHLDDLSRQQLLPPALSCGQMTGQESDEKDSQPINLTVFRAYVLAYLQRHRYIHHDMTCMVRHLASSAKGIPIELYCFTTTVVWSEYENIQSDIFDHLFAILPMFHLRLYQQPSGYDMQTALTRLDSSVSSPFLKE